MVKPNYRQQKRQKEISRKARHDEKLLKRAGRLQSGVLTEHAAGLAAEEQHTAAPAPAAAAAPASADASVVPPTAAAPVLVP